MVGNLFGRTRSSGKPAIRRGPPGKRCYAIGDIHGRLDLLDQMLVEIQKHDASRSARETVVVSLGDIIDRGPDSRGVVERLMQPLPFAARLICLKGNHEEMLVRGLAGEIQILRNWLATGGRDCARSYGIDPILLDGQPDEIIEHNLGSAIPGRHLTFLASLPDTARFGDYLLVHAGIRPGVELAAQRPSDLRWIRKGFLDADEDHGFVVVHGHSVALEIEKRPNRIGIDTGAYKTGILTAIWIEDDQYGFLQAVGPRDEHRN
jgi:serine/threonine protein phosphatase 1